MAIKLPPPPSTVWSPELLSVLEKARKKAAKTWKTSTGHDEQTRMFLALRDAFYTLKKDWPFSKPFPYLPPRYDEVQLYRIGEPAETPTIQKTKKGFIIK